MPKYLLEDMVKPKYQKKISEPKNNDWFKKKVTEKKITENKNSNKSRYYLWFVAFICVGFLVFAVSFLFSKAEITVKQKTTDTTLNKNLLANPDPSEGGLFFDLVVIDGVESKNIQATDKKYIEESATGTAVLYNAFSSSPQVLNIDTRLEGSNDKIYKTKTKIVVPGMRKDGTPGSIEVKIYAAETGEEYNSNPLDFKILGFKGTSKYAKFYGRSMGNIVGGFKGDVPDITEEEKTTAINGLKASLRAKLLKKAADQIPEGFLLFKDAIFLDIDDSAIFSTNNNKDNITTLTLKGVLRGILFNEDKLTKKILEGGIESTDDVYISNIKDLIFSLADKDANSLKDAKSINFNISGTAKVTWRFDTDKFVSDLLGKSKKDFNQVLAGYKNIDSAELIMSPFWRISIPDKVEDIKITIVNP